MAGKRYPENEIARIIELKNEGKTNEEVRNIIKTEFNTERPDSAIRIIHGRSKKASEPAKAAA